MTWMLGWNPAAGPRHSAIPALIDRKMSEKKEPEKGLTDGGRFAVVPWDVLVDTEISRSARWLYALLCSHADKNGFCRRSLKKIAKQEGVSKRTVQLWLNELEAAGRVIKHNERGKMGIYEVIRHADRVNSTKAKNLANVIERRAFFGNCGRKGAAARAALKASDGVTFSQQPVNSVSPPRETDFAPSEVNRISPEHDHNNNTRGTRRECGIPASPLSDDPAPAPMHGTKFSNGGGYGQPDCLQGKHGKTAHIRLVERFGGAENGWRVLMGIPGEVLEELTRKELAGTLTDAEALEIVKKTVV